MHSGSPIRNLARALDSSGALFWWIGSDGNLRYLSGAAASFLGLNDADDLVGRRSGVPVTTSDDRLDQLAALLAPPPDLHRTGWRFAEVPSPNQTSTDRAAPSVAAPDRAAPDPAAPNRATPGQTASVRSVHFVALPGGDVVAIGGELHAPHDWQAIRHATLDRYTLDRHRRGHSHLTSLVTAGTSDAARLNRRRIKLATQTKIDFFIRGPVGCGAELIAESVARRSAPGNDRQSVGNQPSVDDHLSDVAAALTIDSSIMDAELLDAALHPAIDELQSDSTATRVVVLHHIDEMPVDAQTRLLHWRSRFDDRLRIVATSTYSHPADSTTSATDVTSPPTRLPDMQDVLRDLLSTLSIEIKPIGTRGEDLRLIALAAVDDACSRLNQNRQARLSADCLDRLRVYPWPGDALELIDTVQSACRTAFRRRRSDDAEMKDVLIEPDDLPLAVRSFRKLPAASMTQSLPLDESIRRHEAECIAAALEESDGNRAAAARLLGISRSRLLRKIEANPSTLQRDAAETDGGS